MISLNKTNRSAPGRPGSAEEKRPAMGKPYRFLFWDVDQTLLDFKKSESYALRETFGRFGREVDDGAVSLYSGINEGLWKRFERGEIGKEELKLERFRLLFQEIGITEIGLQDFQDVYQALLGSVCYYLDDSYTLCMELKENYRQYVVSNGVSVTQRRKMELSGFGELMDGVFISEEIGAPKPQRAFYEFCFSRIPAFAPEAALAVGDSLSSDILGARAAGIDACWYNPSGLPFSGNPEDAPDYTIQNLREIKKILGEE